MRITRPPRVFDLIDNGDGVSWVPHDDHAPGGTGHLLAFPVLEGAAPFGGASVGASSYRTTAERRIERRKRARPRKLDVTA
jgi:hypothetical protein